jgi:hypothetical protein
MVQYLIKHMDNFTFNVNLKVEAAGQFETSVTT